ncbi:src like adaptor 1a [Aplochiton taeniatus]
MTVHQKLLTTVANWTFYTGSEDVTLVVLQDYPSRDISEPIFRMGEKLKVISQEANWWRVCCNKTGNDNYIPNNYVAKVYHGWLFEGVVRQKAEELLNLPGNRPGSFLIRESTNERGVYSVSVKHRAIKHYRIFRLDNSWYYISPRLTFQCLEDLVNHYSDCAEGLCCLLTTPCLSGTLQPADAPPQAPPVVMRHTFDWNKLDSKDLINAENPGCPGNKDGMVSYGVRNSIAAYLSMSGALDQTQKNNRKKKSKSVYATPEAGRNHLDYEDAF